MNPPGGFEVQAKRAPVSMKLRPSHLELRFRVYQPAARERSAYGCNPDSYVLTGTISRHKVHPRINDIATEYESGGRQLYGAGASD
jgi:hypothetical protein